MIWLTWRQHRVILIIGTITAVALVVWMLVVEHDYVSSRDTLTRLCPSLGSSSPGGGPLSVGCTIAEAQLVHATDQAAIIRLLLLGAPLFAGVLLGAPLVAAELEHDTVLLAFTQGISRTRWLITRWLTVLAPVVVVAAALTAFLNWWFWHVQTTGGVSNGGLATSVVEGASRIRRGTFDDMGIVLVAYAIFALALGAALGAVLRRTFWAGLVTVAAFVTARLSFVFWIRPYLVAPLFQPESIGAAPLTSASPIWVVSDAYRDVPGSRVPLNAASIEHVTTLCSQASSGPGFQIYGIYDKCLAAHGIQFGTYYQPSSRFWVLQWGEAAIFVAAAVALFGVTLWAVRRWRA